jgi:tellurium resistance protein TerD
MAISLTKGGNVSLSKSAPGLTHISIGLGWNARKTDGVAFDLDACAFILKSDGKVRSDADFIFFNQMESPDGSVRHTGDNRTGEGEGDDEVIKVNLALLPHNVDKVAITVTIHDDDHRLNFGMVSQACVRVVNDDDNSEIVRYDLSEDFSIETALIFGELYRHNGEWKFRAVGQGFNGGLGAMAKTFGVDV